MVAPGVVRGTSVNQAGRLTVSIPDPFDGSLIPTLAQLLERSGDDGAGGGDVVMSLNMASGRMEAGVLDEQCDGTGNL